MAESTGRRRRAARVEQVEPEEVYFEKTVSEGDAEDMTGRGSKPDWVGGEYPHEHPVLNEALALLATRLAELASYDLLGDVMTHGFKTLSAQLEPLRQLVPPSVPELDRDVYLAMVQVQASLDRPSWLNTGTLQVLDRFAALPIGGRPDPDLVQR
jgi:hypothetical protein